MLHGFSSFASARHVLFLNQRNSVATSVDQGNVITIDSLVFLSLPFGNRSKFLWVLMQYHIFNVFANLAISVRKFRSYVDIPEAYFVWFWSFSLWFGVRMAYSQGVSVSP
jgi:hypothetical protein